MPISVVAVSYGHFLATHLILYRVSWRGGNISVQSYSVLNYFPTAAEQNPNVISFFFSHERGGHVQMVPYRKPREHHMFPDLIFLVALSWRKLCTELHVLGNSVQNCPVSRGPVCETGEIPDTLPYIFGTITTRS